MNKKRGMSIAAVLGIMVCLASIVTTVFILAARSSILTSRSLRYIESYNDASSSIDNAVQFMVDEANVDGTIITGDFVNEKCDAMTMLFGVVCTPSVAAGTDKIDMNVGFVIEIKKEYYTTGNDVAYLRSVVEFSATMTGGAPQIITSDLAIDKETVLDSKWDLYSGKYNSTNLLFNYFCDQMNVFDDEPSTNVFFKTLSQTRGGNIFDRIDNLLSALNMGFNDFASDSDIFNFEDDKITVPFLIWELSYHHTTKEYIAEIVQTLSSKWHLIKGPNGENSVEINDFNRNDGQPDLIHNPLFAKYNANGEQVAVVVDRNTRINNAGQKMPEKPIDIYVTNNSILYIRSDLKLHCNIYVERGSTIVTEKNLNVVAYKKDGAYVAPVLDTDYPTARSNAYEAANGSVVGGGLICQGKFYYSGINQEDSKNGCFLNDNRLIYNYNTSSNSVSLTRSSAENNAYINGGFFVANHFTMEYNYNKKNSDKKISAGITVYCDNEINIKNLGFASDTEGVRPFLLFGNGELYMDYCCSLVDGSRVPYKQGIWEELDAEKRRVGFGVICVEKVGSLKGNIKDLIKFNIFYSNSEEMQSGKVNLLDATHAWQDENGTLNGYNNGLVSDMVFQHCTNDIETDSIHWFIPDKLRGTFVQAAISSTQSNASKA